jgi:transposase-like protein/transposase Tn5 family protein
MGTDWAASEMEGAHLWDRRRRRSLAVLCARLAQQPAASFSAACGPGLRQAAHRLFEHSATTIAALLAGHVERTAARCRDQAVVLAVQDSTEFDYTTHKATTGLGPIGRGQGRGLLGHTVLAVTPTGLPLGLLHLAIWARDPAQRGQRHDRRQRVTAQKESQKWLAGLQATEAALPPEQPVILVADREADVFAYLAAPRRSNTALLFRACHPRTVSEAGPAAGDAEHASLLAVAQSAPLVGQMQVILPRQPGQPERAVSLALRFTAVQVQPPRHRKAGEPATPQAGWLITASEVAPAAGTEPIQWLLVTTLAVEGAAVAEQLVRYYACRWVIERWHYTLKVGLQVERLQIDDATSLQHALAVYGVVAWRRLWLTYWAREAPEQPAISVIGPTEQAVLTQASGRPVETVRQAARAIARLGGFAGSPSEGEPGVKSLWLGLRRLEAMGEGWRLARQALSYDPVDMTHG